MLVSAEAKGGARVALAALAAEAARMDQAVALLPAAMVAAASRKDLGARLALTRIIERLPAPPVHRTARIAVWRIFRPVTSLPGESEAGGRAVLAEAFLMVPGAYAMTRQPFGLAITAHAIGRLLDRSDFTVDATAAMAEAHDALMAVTPIDGGEKLFDLGDLTLPAGGGAFLCNSRRFGPNLAPLTVAKTWVAEHQARRDQLAHLQAWAQLFAQNIPTEVSNERRQII